MDTGVRAWYGQEMLLTLPGNRSPIMKPVVNYFNVAATVVGFKKQI
jgi:hypothetical protein